MTLFNQTSLSHLFPLSQIKVLQQWQKIRVLNVSEADGFGVHLNGTMRNPQVQITRGQIKENAVTASQTRLKQKLITLRLVQQT